MAYLFEIAARRYAQTCYNYAFDRDYNRNGRVLCLFIIMVVCRKTSVLSILFLTFSDLNSKFRQDN